MNATLALRAVALLCLSACQPGPKLSLGSLPDEDADSDERDGGARESCRDHDECDHPERPFCNDAINRCVACINDRQCDDGEYCVERWGECVLPEPER